MQEIIPNLYLGSRESTKNSKKVGIDYIISIGSQSQEPSIENFHFGLRDDKTLDISNELDVITDLLNDLLNKDKKVLVHCKAGINKKPTLYKTHYVRQLRC